MIAEIIYSRWTSMSAALLVGVIVLWVALKMEPEVSPTVIESFAAQQVVKHIGPYDYGRFDDPVLTDAGYRNDHYVSGTGTFIRFGRDGDSRIPTTEFQKIRYVVVVTVTCASWTTQDCLAVRNITILNDQTKRPLI